MARGKPQPTAGCDRPNETHLGPSPTMSDDTPSFRKMSAMALRLPTPRAAAAEEPPCVRRRVTDQALGSRRKDTTRRQQEQSTSARAAPVRRRVPCLGRKELHSCA